MQLALKIAIEKGHLDTARMFLDVDTTTTPQHEEWAIQSGHQDVAEVLSAARLNPALTLLKEQTLEERLHEKLENAEALGDAIHLE